MDTPAKTESLRFMSDYSDFCESYGGCPSDPEFMDRWIEEYANDRDPIDFFVSLQEQKNLKLQFCNAKEEWDQVKDYVRIYIENNCVKDHEVNDIISMQNDWDKFTEIRSMNEHSNGFIVEGISSKHFRLVCEILKIAGGDGASLVKDERY